MGAGAPAPTEDMRTRISPVMGVWILMISLSLGVLVVTAGPLRVIPRTREVGERALRALMLVPRGPLWDGYYLLLA